MEITCPECRQTFMVGQKYPYHAGFGNQVFLYCELCPNLVVFSSYDSRYTAIVGQVNPWGLDFVRKSAVERQLKACACGENFRFPAKPRCPLCNAEIPGILPDGIHYIETGRRFDGDKELIWND